jgi:hypothetical protein
MRVVSILVQLFIAAIGALAFYSLVTLPGLSSIQAGIILIVVAIFLGSLAVVEAIGKLRAELAHALRSVE